MLSHDCLLNTNSTGSIDKTTERHRKYIALDNVIMESHVAAVPTSSL